MSDKIRLGELLADDPGRDAVHIAIVPVTANAKLYPAQRVRVVNGTSLAEPSDDDHAPVGIVDPYLTQPVFKGERFYLCLFPNTVTSLRHVWTHPQFSDEPKVNAPASNSLKGLADKDLSEKWLRFYALKMNTYDHDPDAAYDRLIEGLKSGELFAHGSDLHGLYELDDADELKRHAEVVLGKEINWGGFTFSCSC